MSFSGFGKNSGPNGPPTAQPPIGYSPSPPFTASPVQPFPRPFASLPNSDMGFQARSRSPTATSVVWASHDATGHILPGQDLKRISSPLLPSNGHNVLSSQPIGNERDGGSFYGLNKVVTPQVTQSSRSPPGNSIHFEKFSHNGDIQRLSVSPPAGGNWTRPPGNSGRSMSWQRQHVSAGSLGTQHQAVQVSKHTRPQLIPSTHEVSQSGFHFNQVDSFSHSLPPPSMSNEYGNSLMLNTMDSQAAQHAKSVHPSATTNMYLQNSVLTRISNGRSSPSPPSLGPRPHSVPARPTSQFHSQMTQSAQSIDKESAMTKTISNPVTKRTRSPPITSTGSTHGIANINQDDHELEIEAKAKRYARFKTELSQPVQTASSIGVQKAPVHRRDPYTERREAPDEHAKDMAVDLPEGMCDYDVQDSSTVIVGSCTDMCPEAERAERERKGDLDQYERLNGDRNHTSKSLAVKKYNRTAEREAELIRPMPVLQRTVDYLLCLLETPYDDRFLRLYNFLWDRMRAIRMDLRMQHIFNLEAIGMLEQMIRLHIIAMHELCEYAKGEGFSEGFDAHLNIEQMNKTSVELFQMYDDHRKRGIIVPTEKEFRGYYALLKLDKHPGYKVEPAELSLDLSKMTAEIRKTPEILFARDVARVCRTGNFIAFFRLARKASYLQACLMHAHFAKLRTQALASLHSGLQNNQGIPMSHVAKWIAMEEEDLESLLEYHGFSIKEYEEPYMVKEGPFLNSESDFTVKCSKLVHMKKSREIVEDIISFSHQSMPLPVERVHESQFNVSPQKEPKLVQVVEPEIQVQVVDEEMAYHESASSPKDKIILKPIHQPFVVDQQSEIDNQMTRSSSLTWESTILPNSPKYQGGSRVGSPRTPKYDKAFRNSLEKNSPLSMNVVVPSLSMDEFEQGKVPGPELDSAVEESVPPTTTTEDLHMDMPLLIENEEVEPSYSYHDEEAAEARLKLILRTWKRHSSKKKELREQKQLAALWALNSLSLGTPIRQSKDHSSSFVEFKIDDILYERQKQWERSRCRLNVSEVVANTLGARNQTAKCLCWKIILFSQIEKHSEDKMQEENQFNAGSWLLSKLMPDDENDDNLVVSSPSLSIWKKWIYEKSADQFDCCLSIVKEISSDNNLEESALGASAVVFVLYGTFSWEVQKKRLHNLLASLSSGSGLPLLILCDLCDETSNPAAIVQNLGLHHIDKSRISSFTIIFLRTSQNFYCDEKLRGGLQWLASESPSQPILKNVKTRELVLRHLSSSLAVLDKTEPDQCISAFNEAIDRASRLVFVTSNENHTFWPCPEINLLEKNTVEYESTKLHLPEVGWSSTKRIEPIIYALEDCKLPEFHDDISWLYEGSKSGREIVEQKLKLENCLFRYLTISSKMMMGEAMAMKEASAILQSSARLLLHESVYYIVPNWVKIFRRIFNWHLMILSNGPCSTAYVKEEDKLALDRMMDIEDSYSYDYPSLDEMIRVSCEDDDYFPDSGNNVAKSTSQIVSDEKLMAFVPYGEFDGEKDNDSSFMSEKEESSSVLICKPSKDSDKLSKLLDQCNILQNTIDSKLSIYF
ncbi:SAC3 family protein B isoform X2 [Impatiens glandulifera]|uniref:SAC3 family protein B isoform X2 n=1 Tax=Impatiens glandulifera TaxID=253017 RepID=UPI001FB0E7E5|nr:SAC3 family protein B isoform X2 [Impatiens glandulifera]